MSSLRRARRSLMRARWPVLAIVLLLGIGFAAVFGPEVAPHDPNRQNIVFRLKQPMQMDRRGRTTFVMGTDGLGRDVFSRLLYGARVSLIVGFVAMLVGGSIGTILGLIAGYCGGPVDRIIMSVADIQLAFPFILLAIMFLLVLGPGVVNLILALGIGQWVTYARIARAQTLSHREKEYVEAAKALGQGHVGILLTGILPNILAPLIIIASFNVASVILAEASLSFLGLGVPPTVPSWGGMLAESRDQLLAGRWWLAVFPGTAIMLTVLSFNILGDWLRDFLDPRLAVTLAVMVLIAAVAPAPAVAQVRGGTLTVGLPYDIDTLNVYATATLGDVESAVIEGLLAPNEHAHYEPVLATEVPTLANGGIELTQHGAAMRVTYHLRRGVTWHDGAPLTSADVKFTWEAVLDPHFLAESKDGTQDIESIDTPDESTVIVNYRTVAPAFASTLFTFGILPRHLLQGKDLNHDPYNDKPLGTGPFMVREFRRGQYVVLDRNPNYWGRDAAGASLPYLDRIVYKLIPSSNTLGALLRAGEVLLAPRIPFMLAKQLEGTANLELVAGPSLGWARLDFGMKGNSLLRDPVLRRAIAAAINRAALVKAAGGYPQPIRSPVLPVLDELYDPSPEAAVPGYDPVAANLALDAAGYRRDADGYRSRNGMPLAFGITTQAGEIDGEIAEQILIAELKAIGIRVAADNKTGIAYRQVRYKGEYDLLYGRWVTAADPVYSVFYGSHGPLNGQGYASAPLDAALARMESSLAAGPRRAASSEMQRIFAHDLPSIPLVNNVSIAAKSTRLKNFVINPTNMTDFIGVAHWYLEPLPAKMP